MSLRRRMQKDIENDIREHIEMMTRENIDRGMSAEDARNAAIRKFGSPLRVAEETRDVWRWMWADRLLQDTRYALRGLRRNPVFAAVAILTLALGIGMNTAVFSVVSAVLVKPLPYPDADRIVWLANYNRMFHFEAPSAPDFADWREQAKSFDEMAAYLTVDSTVQDGDQSAKHSFVSITPEFWRIAGAHAALGRLFGANDRNVMVLTWRVFEQRFGANRNVIGRGVKVDGKQTSIIGVLPKDFRFLPPSTLAGGMTGEAEVFTPFVITPELRDRARGSLITFVVAKLKAGISMEQARTELKTIQARIAAQVPAMMRDFYRLSDLRVIPLQEKLVGGSRRALLILLAAVAFVLLIACANLGNLLLARASARQSEIAIRAAIGAGRGRLLRQFMVEGLTLALAGGVLGLAVARGADALLLRVNPSAIPRLGEVDIDWRVLAFTLVVSTLAGSIFGLAPILSLSANSLYSSLKEGGRSSSAATVGLHLRRILVAGELALAMVLLAGAGLMVKSFMRMYAHPATFQPEKIGVMKVFLSGPVYKEASTLPDAVSPSQRAAAMAYTRRLLDRVGHMPGVDGVALDGVTVGGPVRLDGPPRWPRGQEPIAWQRVVSAGYTRVVGIPLLKGRWLTDDEPSRVVVVNETFVRRVFGTEDPIGKRVGGDTIVGVVGDLKTSRLDAGPDPEVLTPYKYSATLRRLEILVKMQGNPLTVLPSVQRVAGSIDPAQPPYGVTTMESALSESIAPRRFNLLLLGTFAVSAVLLALIGIYGVMSYAVTQRTREIGVRMALGAPRAEIVRMVLVQGMAVAIAGIAAGTATALGLTRLMTALLYEVKPTDPWTFAAVGIGLVFTALAASWIPALKAAGVDPLLALRHE